jgi:hypothetical protein
MFTIIEDPAQKIPIIKENYIKNKIVLLQLTYRNTRDDYFYVPVKIDNKLYWYGGKSISSFLNYSTDLWSNSRSASLLELLIWIWREFPSGISNFYKTVYIIDNRNELTELIVKFKMDNKKLIKLLLEYNMEII